MGKRLDQLAALLSDRRWPLVVLLAVIVPHLLFLLLTPTPPVSSDAQIYHLLGKSLSEGNGYQLDGKPHSDFMPGYALFIAVVYSLTGPEPWAVRMAQVFLFGGALYLNFLTIKRLLSARVATISFLLLALLPAFFVYPSTLNAEIWVVSLISLFLFISLREPLEGRATELASEQNAASNGVSPSSDAQTPKPPLYLPSNKKNLLLWSLASGASCAAIALSKPEMFLWAPLTAILILCHRKGWSLAVQSGLAAALGFLLVLSPWIIRNYQLFDRFVPFSTAGGRTLWLSAHEPDLTEYSAPEFQKALSQCLVPNDPPATDACLSKDAARMIKEHPAYFAKSAVKRVTRTLIGSHTEYLIGYDAAFSEARAKGFHSVFIVKGSLLVINALFVGLGLLGLLLLCRRLRWWPLLYLVATKLAIHGVFFGTPRYGLHLAPLFALCAATLLVYRGKTPDEEAS